MFGLGAKKTTEEGASTISVSAMPKEFYGGVNPAVTFKSVTKEVTLGGLTAGEKKAFDRATAPGSGKPLHPANLFSNRRFLIIVGIVLFVLFTIGATWYYIRQANPPRPRPTAAPLPPPAPTPTPPVVTEQPPLVVTTTLEATSTPPAPETPTTTPVLSTGGLMEFPSLILGSSQDSDHDGLSDPEEELFKTDPLNPDTDGDGYLDGSEVYHLYNPIGKEPQKLIDSGLVKDFVNPVFGYQLYYPISWATGNIDQSYRDMLFSTLTGENVEVRVFDRDPGASLADWFSNFAPTENINSLENYTSVFKEVGLRRPDGLVFYFSRPNQIIVLAYHPAVGETVVNYRSVLAMMAQSFRWPGNGALLPAPSPAVVFDTTSTATGTPAAEIPPPPTPPAPSSTATSTQGTL